MTAPLYYDAQAPASVNHGHRGLWFDRFFNRYSEEWKLDDTAKKGWIDTVTVGKAGDREQCEAAVQRISTLCSALCGESRVYAASWHLTTGLGNPHPVENGFLWHPTLGTPYIAGSAVKGLVRAWVESWQGFDDENDRPATLYRWFGSEDKDPIERKKRRAAGFNPPSQGQDLDTEAGGFIFFDALPVEPVTLKADVMTPHMGKWYEKGGEINSVNEAERIPADWHDPVPVCFLVADRPIFLFAIAPRTKVAIGELDEVMNALGQALEWLGAGAKTAVGYGVMERNQKTEGEITQQVRQADEDSRRRSEEGAKLAAMDPFERSIQEFLNDRPDKSQSEISALINAIKSAKWQGGEHQQAVRILERKMKATSGAWKEATQAKKPERDREYKNTLLVKQWLTETR
ncbi:MAG: type III-B CRISPR module RAMP protein Cmr6 [Gammaproteobacteria bacterium]|nr:type III-B CRISPR module RAMP protein Cmr6 [Gammaproteobacteria bacterium]MBU1655934.1 type III-B CRISPR module RAMP protein Cmr6 [Gammaproteobacteria bacterium]MBU1961806.1 type III-B CRISPR module RAMP protein Cmr6 [Gammaproteobacteria bacterium]